MDSKNLSWDKYPGGLSVVIPAYNEINTIEEILKRVEATGVVKQIVVVDDGSTDGTREFLEKKRDNGLYTIHFHEKNGGKGAAVRTGFSLVNADIVLVQDADLEYNPKDFPILLEPILDGRADVVFGSRFLGGPHRVLFFRHYIANKVLTFLSNLFTNLNLTDMEVGYKVFTKEVLDGIEIESARFNFEPEITAKVAKKKVRVYEVPISYAGRTYEEGKKIGVMDGFEALWTIVKYSFFS